MRLTLKEHNATNIKRARHVLRSSSLRSSLTVRNGRIYTMRYNPGVQPRTESQQNSWSLFKEANRLAAIDFHDPARKAYWLRKFRQQSRYKTARGLAKAHYIALLKAQSSRPKQDVQAPSCLSVSVLHHRPAIVDSPPSHKAVSHASTPCLRLRHGLLRHFLQKDESRLLHSRRDSK